MSTKDPMTVIAAAMEQQTELLKELRTKTPAGTTTATPLHGIGGVFAGPGMDRDVLTAHVRPMGLAAYLRRYGNLDESPTYGTITGYTDVIGDELTLSTVCGDAPYGYMKGCNLTAKFGLIRRDTATLDMLEIIRKVNRGDFTDLIVHGQVLGMQDFYPQGMNQADILNLYVMSEMVGVGVQTERVINTGLWQSTIAAMPYFPGLDAQIATGQVDADTNTACPSLDSDVKGFAYDDVCGTGRDIVEYMSMMAYYLQWNAEGMGLDPVEWVVVMRPQLWYELTACWPCRYNTNRCTSIGGDHQVITDGRENVAERDRMRREMTIDINGRRYPVVVDTGIRELGPADSANILPGQYASSIYFVPLRIRSGGAGMGLDVCQLQYLDYRAAQPEVALLRGKEDFFWTDNGLFSWTIDHNGWCVKLKLRTEPRVVLRAPQLAGKIQNVKYTPLQHLRDPEPDSPYHADGGVSLRGASTRYAVWATQGVR